MKKTVRYGLVVLAIAVGCSMLRARGADDDDVAAKKLQGKPAPAVTAKLLDGGTLNLADHKGKDIVMLDFWATWCGPCVFALPTEAEVAKAYADKGVVFYAVNQQEEPADVKEFLKSKNLDIKCALDPDNKFSDAFAVNGIPETVIIGKDGIIKYVDVGVWPDKDKLTKELSTALDQAVSDSKK